MSVALDVFWQFGCQEPLSRRKIRRILCNIRHAGSDACRRHAILHKKNGQPRREDRRIAARQRDKRNDIQQRLEDMEAYDEPEPQALAYNEDAYEFEEERLYIEEEEIFLMIIEHGLQEGTKATRLIGCPSYFEDQVSDLEIDPEIGDLTTAGIIEDFERETFQGIAA